MRSIWKRLITVTAVCLTTAWGGILWSGAADAAAVDSGSLTMTSDPGDFVGGGVPHSYSTQAGDVFSTSGGDSAITAFVSAANGDFWFLSFAAPTGQVLAPGTFSGAIRFATSAAPGLDVEGIGRGCNTVTGSFTVTDLTIVQGFIQTFDVTFEQHCEGAAAALRGDLRIQNPPPPPPLQLGVGVSSQGTASRLDGKATVQGTVTCSQATPVNVRGELTEVAHRTIIRGTVNVTVSCTPDAPAAWQATVDPIGTTPYQNGDAEAAVTASATDPFFGNLITVDETAVVRLKQVQGLPLAA